MIKIAAQREIQQIDRFEKQSGLYEEFAARFPFPETDDQDLAIVETLEDLTTGRPMDRLICGDVGFGKTEVALRASFVVAMSGSQVAVVVFRLRNRRTAAPTERHAEESCARQCEILDLIRAALEAADFNSTRGDFAFGNNHHPIQNIYVREVIKEGDVYTNKIVGTALENHADAYAPECKM